MAKPKSEPKTEADFLEQEKAKERARVKNSAALAAAAEEDNQALPETEHVSGPKRPAPDKGGRVMCWDPLGLGGRGCFRRFPAIDAYAGIAAGTLLVRAPNGEPHPELDRVPDLPPEPPKHTPKPDTAPGSVPVHNAPDED